MIKTKHDYSEKLDYVETQNESIWGKGDPETWEVLCLLEKEGKINGNWLHFAAGDGRYNNWLLSNTDQVTATDIDNGALKKLLRITPDRLKKKLLTQVQDITIIFPYATGHFDGVFNTGTLHLFPKEMLKDTFSEVARVTKSGGVFIFDFATDIKRQRENESMIQISETKYTKKEANQLIKELLGNTYEYELHFCKVPPEEITSGEGSYTFSCNYWLVVATNISPTS